MGSVTLFGMHGRIHRAFVCNSMRLQKDCICLCVAHSPSVGHYFTCVVTGLGAVSELSSGLSCTTVLV